ncbi:MoxR-like ATPase [Ferrithrix thermotolerans DSM 19514]|jgi:MoxR-like ATPase|uniref:MoxR-like ATPase n=1 Tax=Ferrithrix thermotolerans DSM 19514 TaxID=1121881 RepID=A0A1M4VQ39_9ACTN|nr:MoxR family ATPase [Ferrithrix thermotolerans]SHE71048.1 MoxR-like ATPase [Ferrithrix thermotolerans DSM 19514]
MNYFGVSGPKELVEVLDRQDYVADEGLATALYLAIALERPLLLEGDAGVGKTEVAKAVSTWLGVPLIRLQCYEGIDVSQAVYEWDYSRQLLHIRTRELVRGVESDENLEQLEDELFSERFLVRRPLLRALDSENYTVKDSELLPPVLLIDEIDRADDEFEAYLLEILSENAVTIPELGRLTSERAPITILTSNRTRDVHDALKRRCLYHWVEHPSFDRELEIIKRKAPGVSEVLVSQVATITQEVRRLGVYKPPGIAEAIDWARSLSLLGSDEIDAEVFAKTLGVLVKYREDEARVKDLDLSSLIRTALERVK